MFVFVDLFLLVWYFLYWEGDLLNVLEWDCLFFGLVKRGDIGDFGWEELEVCCCRLICERDLLYMLLKLFCFLVVCLGFKFCILILLLLFFLEICIGGGVKVEGGELIVVMKLGWFWI